MKRNSKIVKRAPLALSLLQIVICVPLLYWFTQGNYKAALLLFAGVIVFSYANEFLAKLLRYWTPLFSYVNLVSARILITSLIFALWWYGFVSNLLITALFVREFIVVVLVVIMHCQSPVPLHVGNEKLSSRLYFLSVLLLELLILVELSFNLVSMSLTSVPFASLVTWYSFFTIAIAILSGCDLILTKLRLTSAGWPFQ